MNIPTWLEYIIALQTILPVVFHATGLDKSPLGAVILPICTDVIGLIKAWVTARKA